MIGEASSERIETVRKATLVVERILKSTHSQVVLVDQLEGDFPAGGGYVTQQAQAAVQAMARLRPDALVLVGGDTALHVLQALKVEKMAVRRELAPGIPLLQSAAGSGELPVVLKAGNHGNEATLVEIVRKLAGSLPM